MILVKRCVSILLPTLLVGCNELGVQGSGNEDSNTTLTVVSWGGGYSNSQSKAYHQPYQRLNPNITIKHETDSYRALDALRQGKTGWDLVDMLVQDAKQACAEGLVIPIDHDQVLAPAPDGGLASEDFFAAALSDCAIPQIAYSRVVAFNTDVFAPGAQPTSIEDFFDAGTFPGPRAITDNAVGILEWALYADGVSPADIYEVLATDDGVTRAFDKLDTIKSDIEFISDSESMNLLAQQEVAFSATYNGRVFHASEVEGEPIEVIWDGQLVEWDVWVVPKGPQQDAVLDYLYWATDAQRLADQAKYIPYGPARKSSLSLVGVYETLGIDMKPHMVTSPINYQHAIPIDTDFWAAHGDTLSQKFEDWKALP